eukprot:5962805-Prymnesium_polylepis.1
MCIRDSAWKERRTKRGSATSATAAARRVGRIDGWVWWIWVCVDVCVCAKAQGGGVGRRAAVAVAGSRKLGRVGRGKRGPDSIVR